MKAVVLAGGAGSRLRPISAETPKPMVRLLDKPVMEYTVELLARHGADEITATLQTLPHKITDYFGDGSPWGVKMKYQVETTPLGTAGGVRACGDMGRDPFIIISGDAVTDFDLSKCVAFHREKNAMATLVLHRQKSLLEYGLVMTNPDGAVARFIEKPSWGQVFTDTVNTGIYVLSPEVLELIPEGEFFDFARDLFPKMLADGLPLYGIAMDGYWCDIGDVRAYMNCCCDALDGKISLPFPAQGRVPPGVYLENPCYIGKNTQFAPGARIGPYAVIGGGSRIAAGASVSYSVLDGVQADPLATAEGAYAGRGAILREGSVLREGAVVGEGVLIGAHAELTGTARVWPHKEVEPRTRVDGSISSGHNRRSAAFAGTGVISGQIHVDLTPEFCMKLGATVGNEFSGETALSGRGGSAVRCILRALETGICAAGGSPVLTDAASAASAAYGTWLHRYPLAIYVNQGDSGVEIHFFDSHGLPIERELERKLEAATARGESVIAAEPGVSRLMHGTGNRHAKAASAVPEWAASVRQEPWNARVSGSGSASEALKSTLALTGCTLNGGVGSPVFRCSDDGMRLTALDENGQQVSYERMLGALLWLDARAGVRAAALPYSAPAFLDECAGQMGIVILRVGRDGKSAREMYASQLHLRDACFAAGYIAHGMNVHGMKLAEIVAQVPAFHIRTVELRLENDRGAVMRALASSQKNAELVEGMRARVGRGWVHVAPMPGRRSLRIMAEGASEEIAGEICDFYLKAAKKMDRQSTGNVI